MTTEATEATAAPTSYTVSPTGERKLRFRGQLIAEQRDRWRNGREQTRWEEIEIYRTTGGNYVAVQRYVTLWQGEEGSVAAQVCRTEEALLDYLGTSELAKAAYAEAEIDCALEVE